MDWFPWYPTKYESETMHLTLAEDGAYRRLIDHYMKTGKPLPDNEQALCRILGVSPDEFLAIAEPVLNFFSAEGGFLYHHKCDEEIQKQKNLSRKRSEYGKKGAEAKSKNQNKTKTSKQKPSKSQVEALAKSATRQDITGHNSSKDISANADECALAFEQYNSIAGENGIPQAQKLSDTRRRKLKARLRDCGGLDGWSVAMGKLAASDFCTGKKTDWRADLDFVLQEKSFTKLMEGAYDNRAGDSERSRPNGGHKKNRGFAEIAAEVAAEMERES